MRKKRKQHKKKNTTNEINEDQKFESKFGYLIEKFFE